MKEGIRVGIRIGLGLGFVSFEILFGIMMLNENGYELGIGIGKGEIRNESVMSGKV